MILIKTKFLRVAALAVFLSLTACSELAGNGQAEGPERGMAAGVPNAFYDIVAWVAVIIEGMGIGVIVLGILLGSYYFLLGVRQREDATTLYNKFREHLGRGILLGLEFLVAADIIGTVAIDPNFRNLAVLGLIVLIRTFLSFAIEAEIHGHWPWQAHHPVEPSTQSGDQ